MYLWHAELLPHSSKKSSLLRLLLSEQKSLFSLPLPTYLLDGGSGVVSLEITFGMPAISGRQSLKSIVKPCGRWFDDNINEKRYVGSSLRSGTRKICAQLRGDRYLVMSSICIATRPRMASASPGRPDGGLDNNTSSMAR